MLKKLIICAAVVVVLAIVGISVGVNISNQPKVVVKKSLENALEDLGERDEFSSVLKMLKEGSLTVEVDREMGDVEGKLYFSDALSPTKAQLYAEDVTLKNAKESLYFSAYLSSDQAYITDSSFLDQTYGISRGGTEEAYLASPLDSLGLLDEEDHVFLSALLRIYDQETDLAIAKDLEKMLKRYDGKLEKIFLAHASIDAENRKVRVCSTRMESRVITITVDNQGLSDMITELYDTVKEDKKLRDLVVKYNEDISNLMGKDFDAVKFYDEEFLNRDAWSDACENLEATGFESSVTLVTAPSSAVLRQLTVNVTTAAGKEELLYLDIGKNGVKTADYVTLDVLDTRYIYEVAESNKKVFEAYLYMEKDVIASLEINKKDDKYSLTLMGQTELLGKYVEDGDTITISLDKIRRGDHTELCDLQVILDMKDSMPKRMEPEKVANLFDLPREDWQKIFALCGYQGLKGTYSSVVDWLGLSLAFDGYGNLVMTAYCAGGNVLQTDAVYEINGDTISIHTRNNGVEEPWFLSGDYPLVISEDWIEIDGVRYEREG